MTFLHDLMKPGHSTKEVEDWDFQTLEEYLDLLFHIRLLHILMHLNNLRPMYEKWPHNEQTRWWVHAEGFSLLKQFLEFQKYIYPRAVQGHPQDSKPSGN